MKKRLQYRQGDVLIERVESIPKDAKKRKREEGLVILARGEATGHHHSFGSRRVSMYAVADEYERLGSGFVEIKTQGGALLRHQEHAPIDVPAGNYRVIRQREYSPEDLRLVAD